mgnify:CR=1 FL=1
MKILVLEDGKRRTAWFKEHFINDEITIVSSVEKAKRYLIEETPEMIFLDHDLDDRIFVDSKEENTGYQLAKFIKKSKKIYNCIIIHSMNPVGARKMKQVLLEGKSASTINVIPFHLMKTYSIPFLKSLVTEV